MAKPGRNEPCPCGSGKKFKKCCGAESPPSRAAQDGYYRFRVALCGTNPEVWRRFLLPVGATFFDLHRAIQDLGWTNSHLWLFLSADGRSIAGVPGENADGESDPDATRVPLATHFAKPADSCSYLYDFGDCWEHEIVLEAIEHRDPSIQRALLDGAHAFPPEDCGGIPGFQRMREFLLTGADPWDDEESLRDWLDPECLEFDLTESKQWFGTVLPELEPSQPTTTEQSRLALPAVPPDRVLELDRETIREVHDELSATLDRVGRRLGLHLGLRKTSFSLTTAKTELEIAVIRDDGIVMTKEAEDFMLRCDEFGLKSADLGREFQVDSLTLRIIGLRPRSKQPVLCVQLAPAEEHPKQFKLCANRVRTLLRTAQRQVADTRPNARERRPQQLRLLGGPGELQQPEG